MDDARKLQYSVEFDTSNASSSVEDLDDQVSGLEEHIGAMEMGAQRFGSGAVSACQSASDAVQNFGKASGAAAEGVDGLSAGADEAGEKARKMGGQWDDTGQDIAQLVSYARTASDALRALSDGLEDVGDGADRAGSKTRNLPKQVDSLGAAFRGATADSLEAGNSISKSFGSGISSALDFSKGKVNTWASNIVTKATGIANAFKNPVNFIRNNLVKALRRARESEDDAGDGADDAANDLDDMGDAGEDAGSQVKEAISGALQTFLGLEAIQQGIDLLKEFGAAAVEAFGAAENTAAKFERTFSAGAAEWVDNYADAVHRSTAEVQSFMVQNQGMYRELGLTAEASEELSKMTTSLAYDFGNAFKMDDAEALAAIQAAIRGDTAALTEYGIVLDDATLKNSAAALGLGTNIEALDDASLAQVRFNAILEQSSDIQQAAINETGGLTNSIKSLKGVFGDFMADAGGKFTPVLEQAVGVVLDAWPTLEPILLSFVDTLAGGLGDVIPVVAELAQDLIPALSQTLGALMDAVGPILDILGSLASAVLPPLASIIGDLSSTVLPPLAGAFEELNTRIMQPLMPVIEEVSGQLLPVLGMVLDTVAQNVGPLADAFMPLISTVLPAFASLVGSLASNVLPPLSEVLGIVVQAVGPIVDVLSTLVQALLPSAETLFDALGTVLSDVVLPVFEAVSPVLSVVADVLGTIAGWVSDLVGTFASGIGAVADWFSGLFGGAKESTDAVEELTGAVNTLDGATRSETSLAVDTFEYSADISTASQNATDAVNEAMTAAREISDTNYSLMADDAETAYASMTLDAEEAWERMTDVASSGADSIISEFDRIVSAAQNVSGASISITGAPASSGDDGDDDDIPHNAGGTDNFPGGWTHINEDGGELAYLPGGSAIIPADKTDAILGDETSSSAAGEIVNNDSSNSTTYEDNSTFAPEISISVTVTGDTASDPEELADLIAQKCKDEAEKLWRQKKEQELHDRAMQEGHAIL